jgi:hypothetical protein
MMHPSTTSSRSLPTFGARPTDIARHPRYFTPTSCSWLNAVEGFFAKLAKQRLKRGVFRGVVDLQATINRFVGRPTNTPSPLSGPQTQTKSSPLSDVGIKC